VVRKGVHVCVFKKQQQLLTYNPTTTQSNAGFSQLTEWNNRLEKLQEEIDAKEERWMELMDLEST